MNTNRNVSFGTGVGTSGSEVESAVFRPEVMWDEPVTRATDGRHAIRERLEGLKTRGLSKVHDVQRLVSDRTSLIRSNVQQSVTTAKSSVRSGVSNGVTRVQSSMRSNPAKWAGIAAGSGFALGLLGRFIQSRNGRHRHLPQLVVIETSC
jgi:ElaB/YqjD/DUF883 family membrane-anchored ribosome-binding protein